MIIRAPEQHEIPKLYGILSQYPSSFRDEIGEAGFVQWFNENAKFPLVGVEHGQILAFVYLDYVSPGHYANVVFAKRKGIDYVQLLNAIREAGLPYYFAFDIVKLTATTPVGHRASVRFLNNVGFTLDGILKKHAKINGVWCDYHLFSYLREALK